jgi:CHAD domain-containing protein
MCCFMAFQLKADESVAKGIKRVFCREVDKALDGLNGVPRARRDEAVHDARKSFKKVRAVLRLVREGLGPKVYRRENTCFRDAGRPLTQVRDAHVLVETLDKLAAHFADHVPPRQFAAARRALQAHQRAVRRQVLDQDNALEKVSVAVHAARQRIVDWTIGPDDWSSVAGGLKRVYKNGRRALGVARSDPTVEKLHEWRKQVKYLWNQLLVLASLWPKLLDELANQAHELGDVLGDDHDLAVLRDMLTEDPDRFGDAATIETLLALTDRRRDELQKTALPLGRRLYSEKPQDFVDRLAAYWRAWRSEAAAHPTGQ